MFAYCQSEDLRFKGEIAIIHGVDAWFHKLFGRWENTGLQLKSPHNGGFAMYLPDHWFSTRKDGNIEEEPSSSNEFQETIVYKSQCSLDCGNPGEGFVTITKMICEENNNGTEYICDPKVITETQPCENLTPCPSEYKYGQWSCWSDCSKSCINSLSDTSYRTRIRTCNQDCTEVSIVIKQD